MPTVMIADEMGKQGLTAPDALPLPDAKYAPEPDAAPKHRRKVPNFAENEDTVKEVLKWCQAYLWKFKDQGQRYAFEKEMDIADELYRAAGNRSSLNSDQAANIDDTKSKVQSATFYSDIRAITANEKIVVLGNEQQLPVKFEPIPGSGDYGEGDSGEEEGKRLARYWNALLSYVWEVAKYDKALALELWRMNKYGNVFVEMAWDRRVDKRWVKSPKFKKKMFGMAGEDKTQITGFSWKQKDVILSDWPKPIVYDLKDVWMDSMIDDVQEQSCVVMRMQNQISDIWAMQRTGQFMNVGDIKKEHFYMGEEINHIKSDRQANANESQDSETPTTLIDIWKFWVRLPIDPETGEWNPAKNLCSWYRVHFAGEVERNPVCLEITPNPYSCGLIPCLMAHALEDDKGAYHLSYCTLGKSYYAQEMSLFDMANDNVRMRNEVPLLVEKGSLDIRNLVFAPGGNRIWAYKAGSREPKELQILDTTQTTLNMLGAVEERRQKILGTNKAFLGEPIGGRQSASGYLGTLDQALKPAIEDAKFKAEQLLPFHAFWVKEMYYDFGDPETTLLITYEDEQMEIKPSNLYGDFRIRVSSIKNFQDSAIKRKQDNELLSTVLPAAQQMGAIDQAGAKIIFRQIFQDRKMEQLGEIFKTNADYDAIRVARSENEAILWQNIFDMPKPEENHAAHLKEHEGHMSSVLLLPDGSRPDDLAIQRMKMHMNMHKQYQQQQASGQGMVGGGQPQQQQQAATSELGATPNPGEMGGDAIAGDMGTMGNLEKPSTGRPPDITA